MKLKSSVFQYEQRRNPNPNLDRLLLLSEVVAGRKQLDWKVSIAEELLQRCFASSLDSCQDLFQSDFPELIEEYVEHGCSKCVSFNRRQTLLADEAYKESRNLRQVRRVTFPALFAHLLVILSDAFVGALDH